MPKQTFRIALLSDLHAFHPTPSRKDVSFLPSNPQVSDPDPFGTLDDLIKKERIVVDLLLCAGDICDKADIRGFQYAWSKLHQLKSALGATELIATCGNHDLNSRHIESHEDPDPKGALQTIAPQFPFDSDDLTNHFWSRNFAISHPYPEVRVLVLNTSAFHGGKDQELDHGRVSKRTIDAIEKKIKNQQNAALNILLCHHHVRPLKGLWGTTPDGEYMQKGSELISMLSTRTASPWLVLHGHRHIPNLEHSRDPDYVVIGASSFSSQSHGKLNQFHILDIEVDISAEQPLKGKIETWSWTQPSGWQSLEVRSEDEGFPPQCGFGSRYQPRATADSLVALIGNTPNFKNWEEIVSHLPDVEYLTPAQLRQVEQLLEANKVKMHRTRDGKLSQIGRSS
jgi:predicted MPP superfamily phosphohydrolase